MTTKNTAMSDDEEDIDVRILDVGRCNPLPLFVRIFFLGNLSTKMQSGISL